MNLSELWDTAEREYVEERVSKARLSPDIANQPWARLSE